jgi:phosphoadenosine phosphosulfate reductase
MIPSSTAAPAQETGAALEDAALDLLRTAASAHTPAVFTSSFGAEDMVVLDLIARHALPIAVVTLDTGRLPRETLDLIERAQARYDIAVTIFRPEPHALNVYVRRHGLNGFYDSVEARKACCGVRKVEPLKRALAGQRAWVTGLRRDQAESRAGVEELEYDAVLRLTKVNPLAHWSSDDVWAHIHGHDVPYNALHDRGYPSIGCEPCTRAIKPGEHPRAGRWWWENDDGRKECGLHVIPIRSSPTLP